MFVFPVHFDSGSSEQLNCYVVAAVGVTDFGHEGVASKQPGGPYL